VSAWFPPSEVYILTGETTLNVGPGYRSGQGGRSWTSVSDSWRRWAVDGTWKNGSGKERVMAGRRTDVGAGSKQQRDASDRKADGGKDEGGI
jgi:hypothetical protein